ncbi:hypothetical protein LINPERPRIM_LOCUS19192 [Linum perenne]
MGIAEGRLLLTLVATLYIIRYFQLDSQAGISILLNNEDTDHQHVLEVIKFKQLIPQEWEVKVSHVYREGNCASES